jgi:DNA-binding NarL/FixJ family response regulator
VFSEHMVRISGNAAGGVPPVAGRLVNQTLIDELAAVLAAGSDDDVALAALRGWQATVPADYHSMMRRTEATGVVDFWNPKAGRLESEHWLVKLFAKLWAAEDPSGTHPAVIAFLQQGPGAYLRSQIEPDEIWHQRAHYQIVDAAHGIKDMVSAFLVPAPGTLVVLNAGSLSAHLDPAIVPPAGRYASVLTTLLTARGGFTATRDDRTDRIDRLTARELQVLRLVRQGKRNAEIAADLGISALTVRKHLENIFAKLSVETRTAAAAMLTAASDR